MKSLTSSPYALFNVNEWHSLTRNCKNIKKNSLSRLEGQSFRNLQQYNSMRSLKKNIKEPKLIQLSFA